MPAGAADSKTRNDPTPEQVRVLDAVVSYFRQHGVRPRFKQMSALLDRQGLRLKPAAESMPQGLLLPDVRPRGGFFRDEDELMVTLRGLRYCTGGTTLLDLLARVLAYFAQREQALIPDATGTTPELLVYRDEVARDLGLSELKLEQARLLIHTYEGRVWSSAGSDGNWHFTIDQEAIRDYRGIRSASDQLRLCNRTWIPPATLVTEPVPKRHAFTLSWDLAKSELGSGPFYLRVHNQGPTCEFEAIAVKVIGVESAPPRWHVRWNQSSARRQEILRGQEWALIVGEDDVASEGHETGPGQHWRFFTPTDTISVTPPRLTDSTYSVSLRVTIRVIPVEDPDAAKENTVSLMFTPQGRSISWDLWKV